MATIQCKVCAHPSRAAIESDLLLGVSNRSAALKWELSKDSVRRHKEGGHLSAANTKLVAEVAAGTARDRLEYIYDRAKVILDNSERQGAAGISLAAIRELRGIVELIAKITGEIDDSPKVQVVNVATSSEWLAIREAMLVALIPYPEAAQAVGQRLLLLEQGSAS